MRFRRCTWLFAGLFAIACPIANGDVIDSQTVAIDGNKYLVVSNDRTTSILPLSIALGNEGTPIPGLSVIVQSGTTLNGVIPYSLTLNLTYRFVLNRDAVTKWVKANRTASPQISLLPSAR